MDCLGNSMQSYKSLRSELRKESRSLYNRLQSIHEDAQYVSKLHEKFPDLPVFANERCGSWYVDPAVLDGSVYFKSVDGHHGRWNFCLKRSNLHVLETMVKHSGIIMIDSTRNGKRIPDSFSKTVPIWCSVINRAIAVLKERRKRQDVNGLDDLMGSLNELGVEKTVVEEEENDFVIEFANSDGDDDDEDDEMETSGAETSSEDSESESEDSSSSSSEDIAFSETEEDNEMKDIEFENATNTWDTDLHTLPIAVSENEHAQILERIPGFVESFLQSPLIANLERVAHLFRKPLRPLWIHSGQIPPFPWKDGKSLDFIPVLLVTASKPAPDGMERRIDVGNGSNSQDWWYVQGAADDHEFWAEGLTPQVFWHHAQQLLSKGPSLSVLDIKPFLTSNIPLNPSTRAQQNSQTNIVWIPNTNIAITTNPVNTDNSNLFTLDYWHFTHVIHCTNTPQSPIPNALATIFPVRNISPQKTQQMFMEILSFVEPFVTELFNNVSQQQPVLLIRSSTAITNSKPLLMAFLIILRFFHDTKSITSKKDIQEKYLELQAKLPPLTMEWMPARAELNRVNEFFLGWSRSNVL